MKAEELDLLEINEAFAAMPLVSTKILAHGDEALQDHLREICNVNGGAMAIGHPMGASGLRLTMTLMLALIHISRGAYEDLGETRALPRKPVRPVLLFYLNQNT